MATVTMASDNIQDRRGVGSRSRVTAGVFGLVGLILFFKGSVFSSLFLIGFAIHTAILGQKVSTPPANNPANFLRRFRTMSPVRPVLVCIGDSLTHGTGSDDWIPRIPILVSEKMKFDRPQRNDFMDPVWIVNAGQNGMLSWTVLKERLQHAISCYPDYILIMIGTNDMLSIYSSFLRVHQIITWSLPETPQMSIFERNLISILDNLTERSPSTQIGICTLPPLGEDLTSPANRLIKEANEIIHNIVEAREGCKCSVIEVNDRLQSEIAKSNSSRKLPLELSALLMPLLMAPLHHYFGIPWQMLSGMTGNRVLFDGVHLNEVGGEIVANLVTEWLFSKNIHKAIAVKQFS